MIKNTFWLVTLVVRGGVEPPTFRFSGEYAALLDVAGYGLMGDLAAETLASCRLMWPDVCRRWLPVWLPGISLASLRVMAARSGRMPDTGPIGRPTWPG
jgi:hypothetical protein